MNEIPEEISKEIENAYQEMSLSPVAVRSSATAEDLPGSSFAGNYDTYLNVRSFRDLLENIKRCWASLWNGRAISYRLKNNISNENLVHGAVVQELVNGEKSGILFTADPVSGKRDRMLLNSSWGPGEAIVSGEVTPDQWLVANDNGKVVKKDIQKKELMTVRTGEGIEPVRVPEEKQLQSSLEEREIEEIVNLGKKVEEFFGSPQDIEWTHDGKKFFFVQSRPITSLYPVPQTPKDKKGLRVHVNFSLVSQGMQEPLTPGGESLLKKMFLCPARIFDRNIQDEKDLWWFQIAGGRMFLDMIDALRNPKRWKDVIENELFSEQEPITARALTQVLEKNKEELIGGKSRVLPWVLKKIVPLLKITGPMAVKSIYGRLFPEKAREKALPSGKTGQSESKK